MAAVTQPDFADRCAAIRRAFEAGWQAGIGILIAHRTRLRASWRNGTTRVLLFGAKGNKSYVPASAVPDMDPVEEVLDAMEGLDLSNDFFAGLVEVRVAEDFDIQNATCPSLCLAGPTRNPHHLDGCPHQNSWKLLDSKI